MRKSSDEHGYTMLEVIMYVSILIVLSGVLAKYVHTVFVRYNTGRVSQQVVDLKNAVMQFTAIDEDYSKLTLEAMKEKRALPLDIRLGIHSLGGKIDVGSVYHKLSVAGKPLSTNDNYLFYITFDTIPKESCVELLTQGQFYGGGTDIDTIIVNEDNDANKRYWTYEYSIYDTSEVNTAQVKIISLKDGKHSIEINVPEAVQACSEKENNTITWIFS